MFALPSDKGGKDLGVFLPIANGGWILSSTAPRLDGSFDYNREVAVLADRTGYDFIMSMAKWRGYGGATQHWRYSLDSQMTMAALAAVTSRVKVWTTVHVLLQNPAVTAKMIATLDRISGGRAGLNVVTGSYRGEFEPMRAWRDHLDHDQRYDMAEEWVTVIKRLWNEERVDFRGRFFTLEDCLSDPKPQRPPFLICAGTSERGVRFTAAQTHAIFASGHDDAELRRICTRARTLAEEAGRRLRAYTLMTLVIGETDAEARAQEDYFRTGFDAEACLGMMRAYGFLDAEMGRDNVFVQSARSAFMSPRLVGSPETVAARLIDLIEGCGLDGVMLVFPDYLASMPVFAAEIMPRIRAAFSSVGVG